jgi:hypothetical protein
MPWMGFEPTIPVFERAKTFHALNCAVAVIGIHMYANYKIVFLKRTDWSNCICHITFITIRNIEVKIQLKIYSVTDFSIRSLNINWAICRKICHARLPHFWSVDFPVNNNMDVAFMQNSEVKQLRSDVIQDTISSFAWRDILKNTYIVTCMGDL